MKGTQKKNLIAHLRSLRGYCFQSFILSQGENPLGIKNIILLIFLFI